MQKYLRKEGWFFTGAKTVGILMNRKCPANLRFHFLS